MSELAPVETEQQAPDALASMLAEVSAEARHQVPSAGPESRAVPLAADATDDVGPRRKGRGRPPKPDGKRAERTLRENRKAHLEARSRLEQHKRPVDQKDTESALRRLVEGARAADKLGLLEPGELRAAYEARLLSEAEVGECMPSVRPAEASAAPAPAAPPASAPSPVPSAASVAAPAAAPVPQPLLVMGVPADKVGRYALPAAAITRVLVRASVRPGFDPTEALDLVYFKGTPAEVEVKGLPEVRLGELLAVELASSIGAKTEAGSPGARRLELAALACVLIGPLLKERAVAAAQSAWALRDKLKEKLQARRAGER